MFCLHSCWDDVPSAIMVYQEVGLMLKRVWILILIGAVAFPLLVNRRPMAVNVVNRLQGTPQLLLDAIRQDRPLDKRPAWEADPVL